MRLISVTLSTIAAVDGLMTIVRLLNKPYFVFRPGQVPRRLAEEIRRHRDGPALQTTDLPWGLPLQCRREEQIGLCIARRGLFDLTVSEALHRLTDAAETVLDVGANVGHMTSLLARRVGSDGRVLAFEPHPDIRSQLEVNVERWRLLGSGNVDVRSEALSNRAGEATLLMEPSFAWNQGSASLQPDRQAGATGVGVATARLDQVLGDESVGVMKLDVEGHERAVLEGAEALLETQRIRDIVFEDFDPPPTSITKYLQAYGYTVFSLDHTLLGPILRSPSTPAGRYSGDDPSYLATWDPERARKRFLKRGWASLRGTPSN